jgi:hypothetical protein
LGNATGAECEGEENFGGLANDRRSLRGRQLCSESLGKLPPDLSIIHYPQLTRFRRCRSPVNYRDFSLPMD